MYRDFAGDTWEYFETVSKNKKIVLFGAGGKAEDILGGLLNRYAIYAIIDNDSRKWGKEILGVSVQPPKLILEEENIVVLIINSYTGVIARQLEEMHFKGLYFSYFWLNMDNRDIREQTGFDEEELDKLHGLLEDEQSKEILRSIVEKRRLGFLDYSDVKTDTEYFLKDIFDITNNEVYIDAGVFDGDSIINFLQAVEYKFKKIYGIEADILNYNKAIENLPDYGEKIQLWNKALWNENMLGSFLTGNNESSKVSENPAIMAAGEMVEFCRLDDALDKEESPTFVKMDIEGAEMEALEGAKEIIRMHKPKLAICIYHKPDDLWKIPLYIHELVPEYKLYIRHHSYHYCDTVLYAVCV